MGAERVSEHGRRALRVRVLADVPDEVAGAVMPLLEEFVDCVPLWVDELAVVWKAGRNPDMPGAVMEIETETNYARATLAVRPAFLGETPAERRSYFLHELVHICHAPIDEHAARVRRALEEKQGDAALLAWAQEQENEASERAVSHVLRMLRALAPGAFAVPGEPKKARR